MTSSLTETDRREMDRRAAELRSRTAAADERTVALHVVELEVGSNRVGIPATGLWRIIETPPVFTLPAQPSWLKGVVALSGELVSAVSFHRLAFGETVGKETPRFLAVVESASRQRLGLLVDQVLGHRDLFEDDLEAALESGGENGESPIAATTADLLNLLDLEKLFAMKALQVGEAQKNREEASPPTRETVRKGD